MEYTVMERTAVSDPKRKLRARPPLPSNWTPPRLPTGSNDLSQRPGRRWWHGVKTAIAWLANGVLALDSLLAFNESACPHCNSTQCQSFGTRPLCDFSVNRLDSIPRRCLICDRDWVPSTSLSFLDMLY